MFETTLKSISLERVLLEVVLGDAQLLDGSIHIKDYLKKNSFKRDALECRLKYAMAIKASRWSKH